METNAWLTDVRPASFDGSKVGRVDDWKAEVKFTVVDGGSTDPEQPIRVMFDFAGPAVAANDTKSFVANVIKALAYTGACSYSNRMCFSACFVDDKDKMSALVRRAIAENVFPSGAEMDDVLTCFGEALVLGVIDAKKSSPELLGPERITIENFLYRMARREDCFLDDTGAKWDGKTPGIGTVAVVDGTEQLPALLLESPGTALLSKYIRAIVICNVNVGADGSRGIWYSILSQTARLGLKELCPLLCLLAQVFQCSNEQLVSDMKQVWEWVDHSFSGQNKTVATAVANAFCVLPYNDASVEERSLQELARSMPEEALGFNNLSKRSDWDASKINFWISFGSLTAGRGLSGEHMKYHYDLLYETMVYEKSINFETDGETSASLQEIASFIEDLEADGNLRPQPRSFASEHLAGEFLATKPLTSGKDCVVDRIVLNCRMAPTIELTSVAEFRIRMERKRAKLIIRQGGELSLEGRDASRLVGDFLRDFQGGSVSVLGFGGGIQMRASPTKATLQGSMVANLVMQGTFGAAAGLWLFSHILYGDLNVSKLSTNTLVRCLGQNDDGLRVNVPIDAEIVASVHAATDGESVYLCLSQSRIFQINRVGRALEATPKEMVVSHLQGCTISPLRGLV